MDKKIIKRYQKNPLRALQHFERDRMNSKDFRLMVDVLLVDDDNKPIVKFPVRTTLRIKREVI